MLGCGAALVAVFCQQDLTLEEFHSYEWAIKDYQKNIIDLEKRRAAVSDLEANVESLRVEKSSIESEIGKSQAQQSELTSKITTLKQQVSDLESRGQDLQSKIISQENNLRSLNKNISESEQKLVVLTRELRLYPSETSEFVRESGRNIKHYVAISIPFVLIFCFATYSLFSRSVDLTQLWRQQEDIDVWTIFLTRLPFVLVALALIETTGYIIGRLIYEILRINRLRLELSKLSIIAKDVSTSSAFNTSLSDDDIFERETKLKMELLREHLKGYSGNEFEYKGGAIISAVSGVANRLIPPKKEG